MATPKLNPSRAISVIPSDECKIPNPALFALEVRAVDSDSDPSTGAWVIITEPDFDLYNISAGDILYAYDDTTGATVVKVEKLPANQYKIYYTGFNILSFDSLIKIYKGEDDSSGCTLYIGTGGNLTVITEGGDYVFFSTIQDATFLPIQVTNALISDTTCSNIIALR